MYCNMYMFIVIVFYGANMCVCMFSNMCMFIVKIGIYGTKMCVYVKRYAYVHSGTCLYMAQICVYVL